MRSHPNHHQEAYDPDYLTEVEFNRRRLRTGFKMLSKIGEEQPPTPPDINQNGSRREAAHILCDDGETYETSFQKMIDDAIAQREHEELVGYADIAKAFRPKPLKVQIKKPSRFLPAENVITKKEAFHAGAKIGTGSYVFYRMKDYARAFFGKRPWPRGGRVAYLVDLMRNEARQINLNIETIIHKFEKLAREQDADPIHSQEKALRLVFLLEENFYKLKTTFANLKMYNGLLKGNATVGFMNSIVKGKESPGEKHPFYEQRDEFYEKEMALMEALIVISLDTIRSLKEQLDVFMLNTDKYEEWKEQHWREIRKQFIKYKGAGAMTGQGLQGLVISIINGGIAAGTKSPAAAAAAIFYFLTTVARVIEIAVRTHLESNLVDHSAHPHDEVTVRRNVKSEAAIKTHENLTTLSKVEVAVNQIEGFGNSGFNIAGTLTGMPLSTGRPATTMPPIESLTAPVMSRLHGMWGRKENTHQPISDYRRGFKPT